MADAEHEALAASLPEEWVKAAVGWYSMHGSGLVRNILAGAVPLIQAAERERIITELQDQADREQQASDAFPSDPGFTGAARAARVMVLIAKGEIGGEGLMP